MTKVLITGSAGFIGFHTAKRLLADGYEVAGVDSLNDYYTPRLKDARHADIAATYPQFQAHTMDLCEIDRVVELFEQFQPDLVCHLAAQPGIRYSLTHPLTYGERNLTAFMNVLEAAKNQGVTRFVYASSSSVYGGNEKLPYSESDTVDQPMSIYAATKRSNELLAGTYSRLFDFQTIGLRLFTVYGPWGRPDMALWKFTESILAGTPISVYNNGEMYRDFTYVEDIVEGILATLRAPGLEKAEVINLGNHRAESIMDLIAEIEQATGKEAIKQLEPLQPGEPVRTFADIDKARRLLDFAPRTTIADGVPRFVDWYRQWTGD
ncbi:UDP-glucose 4-epimerase [Symmachiella macrocystis]|uniref:UDP-glucose 4-epimerase n=1 Tax=Symmachiella macrocystis TaxID=2527985 RepID=A0A5C6BMV9_9PLAN|nr:NAD-dependent epimerase/dehydratase family protein [Symmachiella macrocystis]TWU11864.1 UDP-glucose 4-epimerase [Symmachiella macrocystis]